MRSLWDALNAWLANAGPSAVLRLDLMAVLIVALLVPVLGLACIGLRDRRRHDA